LIAAYYSDGSINKYKAWDGSQRLDYFFTFDSFEFDGNQVDLMPIGSVFSLPNFN